MFSSSKRPPETKASQSQGFQTMRNSILLTMFLQDHGILFPETDFGRILVPFWIDLSKYLSECIMIEQKSDMSYNYDCRSIARVFFHDGAKHSPSSLPQGGPFGRFFGVLLRGLFFVFNPMFSSSKRPPETKASQYQGFQTMRNSIPSTIFLQDHGICPAETDCGPILAPFWIELSKYLSECIRID